MERRRLETAEQLLDSTRLPVGVRAPGEEALLSLQPLIRYVQCYGSKSGQASH